MASGLTIQAGPLKGEIAWGGTDAQFQAALLDYLELRGLDPKGTNQQKLDRVAKDLWDRMGKEVVQYRRDKRMGEQRAALEQELQSDLPFNF